MEIILDFSQSSNTELKQNNAGSQILISWLLF